MPILQPIIHSNYLLICIMSTVKRGCHTSHTSHTSRDEVSGSANRLWRHRRAVIRLDRKEGSDRVITITCTVHNLSLCRQPHLGQPTLFFRLLHLFYIEATHPFFCFIILGRFSQRDMINNAVFERFTMATRHTLLQVVAWRGAMLLSRIGTPVNNYNTKIIQRQNAFAI